MLTLSTHEKPHENKMSFLMSSMRKKLSAYAEWDKKSSRDLRDNYTVAWWRELINVYFKKGESLQKNQTNLSKTPFYSINSNGFESFQH